MQKKNKKKIQKNVENTHKKDKTCQNFDFFGPFLFTKTQIFYKKDHQKKELKNLI